MPTQQSPDTDNKNQEQVEINFLWMKFRSNNPSSKTIIILMMWLIFFLVLVVLLPASVLLRWFSG
jgi:hypothetical protein